MREQLNEREKRCQEIASEKGASAVFSVVPIEDYNFAIRSKRDWRDLVLMRYDKHVPNLPQKCGCGKPYSLDHSQVCPKGGFIHLRHGEIKILFAKEVAKAGFKDVELEPGLTPLQGEEDGMNLKSANKTEDARSDIRVRDYWGNKKNAFFDVRVFYPFAPSYRTVKLSALYQRFSKEKKRQYAQRVNEVEDGSFTPLIMSSLGGMGPEMNLVIKYLAARLAGGAVEISDQVYSKEVNRLRCKFAFAVARSALVCLRGSRTLFKYSRKVNEEENDPTDLVANRARF
jgi:hypothetical protein